MTRLKFGLACLVLLASGCPFATSPEEEVLILEVASQTVECVGEGVHRCLRVRTPPESEWRTFYGEIEGFQHEEGFRYVLEVTRRRVEDPPADGSRFTYTLRRILERERVVAGSVPAVQGEPTPEAAACRPNPKGDGPCTSLTAF